MSVRCLPQLSVLLLSAVVSLPSRSLADEDPNWVRIQLDARFRSEGAGAGDFNGDNVPDVFAGDVWYQAPALNSADYLDPARWQVHEIRQPGEFVAGKGYSNSFANFTWDVDGDGWQDAILIGFPGDPFHWYRNPGKDGGHWTEHVIWTSACNESPELEDLDKDGVPEFVLASQPEAQMGFVRLPTRKNPSQMSTFQPVSTPSQDPADSRTRGMDNGTFKYSHGLGVTDVNLDGHQDIVASHGWWESPGHLNSDGNWAFHPIRISTDDGEQPLPKSANMFARDFDKDGDADLILSSAHAHGVWWAENPGDNGLWTLHPIDTSYSQTHAMEEVDVNGDGRLDYVTGKRFFAHNGGDPGAHDTVVMYWYEVNYSAATGVQFTGHEIVAGRDTGVGTQFSIHDMNADGRPDIVLSNKKGVNVLLQKSAEQ